MTERIVLSTDHILQASAKDMKTVLQEHGLHVDFDPDALKAKYNEEKRKRVNPGGIAQYRFARTSEYLKPFLEDPHGDSMFTREPIKAEYEVAIIGAGYSGIQAAIHLIQQGVNDLCIIEKGHGFGGTWYWNRYPGAQCDVESYIYMPLLEEIDYVPTEKYARGPELLRHANNLAEKFDLFSKTHFGTENKRMVWDEDRSKWRIETNFQDEIYAKWVIPAPGPLSFPKFPGIPGIESFKGKNIHSCRWDWSYSGGSPENPTLTGLTDKRVGVVGTGATGIQLIPRLAEFAKELYVFQRTPSSIDVRNNRPTSEKWKSTLKAGWQAERQNNFSTLVNGGAVDEDMVNDGWTDIFRKVSSHLVGLEENGPEDKGNEEDPQLHLARMQLADFTKMEEIRERVDTLVENPETAERLKPWYNQFCKRPCFHDEYLQVFNKPNVHLIDTEGKGLDRVTEHGVIAGGQEVELDFIIWATGFEWSGDFSGRAGTEIVGRGGQTLTQKFEDGISTFHGWGVHGFPNLMILTFHQAGLTPNWTHSMTEMTRHLAYIVAQCGQRGVTVAEPSQEAEAAWVQKCVDAAKGRGEFLADCTPGYYSDEGVVDLKTLRSQPYCAGGPVFFNMIANWREENKLAGLNLTQG